eukprot:gene20661-51311_t
MRGPFGAAWAVFSACAIGGAVMLSRRYCAGIDSVTAYGDSAGGTLMLRAETERTCADVCDGWEACAFPKVERVLLLYGILDGTSWRDERLHSISWVENILAIAGVTFCMDCFNPQDSFQGLCGWVLRRRRRGDGFFCGRVTFADVVDTSAHLPPTLLICGDKDPLLLSSRKVEAMMGRRGFVARLSTYPTRHAFIG